MTSLSQRLASRCSAGESVVANWQHVSDDGNVFQRASIPVPPLLTNKSSLWTAVEWFRAESRYDQTQPPTSLPPLYALTSIDIFALLSVKGMDMRPGGRVAAPTGRDGLALYRQSRWERSSPEMVLRGHTGRDIATCSSFRSCRKSKRLLKLPL